MRFYTKSECDAWLTDKGRSKPDKTSHPHSERFEYPKEPYRFYAVASWLAHSMTFRQPVMLWITEWDIWPSSENWHLYYKLRQSYGDLRLLHESPGHLFLGHESEDLASFTQIAMLNGWGGYILTQADYLNASFSHDEYIEIFTKSADQLSEARCYFESA